jgi:polysaccharide pyruvyl transferase WcaK-like protein
MKSILLMNSSFKNKGDALMAESIKRKIGVDNDWAVFANLAFVSPKESKDFKVCMYSDLPGDTKKQKIFNALVFLAAKILGLVPSSLRNKFGFIILEDIDVAIDVSGYCYGDHWGQRRVFSGALIYKKLSEVGSKVILMPKTWGPFKTISKDSLDELFKYSDIAFARDENSKNMLDSMVNSEGRDKIFFAPDYTHEISISPQESVGNKCSYIIPSSRVIDSGTLSRGDYYEILSIARNEFSRMGLSVKLLIHETSDDLNFITDCEKMGFSVDDVVVVSDPVELKKTISSASAVLTSRLHGLYNALNSIVPVVVIGWCFKYQEALVQYGCLDCLVDLNRPIESVKEKLFLIANPVEVERLKDKMIKGKKKSAIESEMMWRKINQVIDSK